VRSRQQVAVDLEQWSASGSPRRWLLRGWWRRGGALGFELGQRGRRSLRAAERRGAYTGELVVFVVGAESLKSTW
jgi:hypothetical protein